MLEVGGHAGEEGVGTPGVTGVSNYDGPDGRRGEDFKPGSGSLHGGRGAYTYHPRRQRWRWVIPLPNSYDTVILGTVGRIVRICQKFVTKIILMTRFDLSRSV